jgi:hypothetical protein
VVNKACKVIVLVVSIFFLWWHCVHVLIFLVLYWNIIDYIVKELAFLVVVCIWNLWKNINCKGRSIAPLIFYGVQTTLWNEGKVIGYSLMLSRGNIACEDSYLNEGHLLLCILFVVYNVMHLIKESSKCSMNVWRLSFSPLRTWVSSFSFQTFFWVFVQFTWIHELLFLVNVLNLFQMQSIELILIIKFLMVWH